MRPGRRLIRVFEDSFLIGLFSFFLRPSLRSEHQADAKDQAGGRTRWQARRTIS